jgi:hypothetical protein
MAGRGEAPARWRAPNLRVGAIVALAAAAAFVLWLVLRNDDSGNSSSAKPAANGTTKGGRSILVAATPASLRSLQKAVRHPVYWLGPRKRTTYELTQTPDGKIYVRYLPRGTRIGVRRATFTIVGTYPVPNALRAVRRAAQESGGVALRLPHGGLGVFNRSAPGNVYLAYPHANLQVEVFDPSPRRARKLVVSGAVRPVG